MIDSSSRETPDPLAERVGEYHNKVLDQIRHDGELRSLRDNYPALREALVHRLSSQKPGWFDRDELMGQTDVMQSQLLETGLLTVERVEVDDDGNPNAGVVTSLEFDYIELLQHLRKEEVISVALHDEIAEVYATYSDGGLTDDRFAAIEDKLGEASDTERDWQVVDSFLQILESSDAYWSVVNSSESASLQNVSCGQTVIWADAAGGLYGMIGGPAWSIIEGAIFSSVAQMNCDM